MRVLFLCHRFPYPPTDGARVRSFHMIAHLSRKHDVTVATLVRSEAEAEGIEGLQNVCESVLVGRVGRAVAAARMVLRLPTPTPSSFGYFYSPDLARQIRNTLAQNRYDAIIVFCSSMAPYVAGKQSVPKLLDFVDMDSQKWLAFAKVHGIPKSLGYWLEGRKLQAAEAAMAPQFDICTCITRAEQETLDSFGTGVMSGWFPNGVDLSYFARNTGDYDRDRICFVGRMDYFPNQQAMVDFCADVLPRIREKRPRVVLSIVGAEPPQDIRDLALTPGIEVTGTVPDVRPWVSTAAVSVAPLKIARGTQNKILESWAMGVPVITSSPTARGVDAVPNKHLVVADTPADMAAGILRLLERPEERSAYSEAGRRKVEEVYTWEAAMTTFDRYLSLAVDRHRQRRSTPLTSL